MISYKITSHEPLKALSKRERKALKKTNPDYKATLYHRLLKRNPFKAGERVRLINTKRTGTILEVVFDINNVNWTAGQPHFIHVMFDDGEEGLATPYQLTRKGL